ncbi:hypothetical protein RJ640_018105 [Escallonia rubra]|uniref:U3 small nucleolar RNA-associated protein 15 C-terminal domain-containing protein n=1 Tax=Escallonia rubra TaxID=112253 RepID=A0AA88QJM3_9ASTE|nr:hypothetical protein RJ640_018105 [Escallonia rubra]
MAEESDQQTTMPKSFPVKPKLKPTSRKSTTTPESKYWRSFKSPDPQNPKKLISSITSLSFSPAAPHDFAATHSATVSIFSAATLEHKSTLSAFTDTATSASYRSDGRLLAAGSYSGKIQVFKTRSILRHLRSHTRPVHFVKYPLADKLHLYSGGDDSIVKYWDVVTETVVSDLIGHKDYVRCGDGCPASDDMFVTGSYDHGIRVWDVRVSRASSVMEVNHGKPVEDVIYLPSGGLIATAGGNTVKIWDVIGGGRLVYSMESHNKTVTSICVGKVGREGGEENRILSVSLDGYMKVFDYSRFKITHSMRFPTALLSIAFSPDSSTRVIGSSNGVLYAGKRSVKENVGSEVAEETKKRALRPSYFRYFHRSQNEKPSEGDYLIMRKKKVKLTEHDKLLKKFRHKEALVSALRGKNPGSVVAVMEELVARKKLLKCVQNLETEEELGLLLGFLQRYMTVPRYAGLLIGFSKKVVEMRAEDVSASEALRVHIRNLKRAVEEEVRIQQSLQEIQGIISPLLRIAGRR